MISEILDKKTLLTNAEVWNSNLSELQILYMVKEIGPSLDLFVGSGSGVAQEFYVK